jgi:peptidoglycan/LPS O-acetylase OafA/YrhL
MGELIVTWHDWVRLALFAINILMLMLVLKLTLARGKWRHPLRDANVFLAIAMVLLLGSSIQQRAEAFGTGPFPHPIATVVSIIGNLCVIVWLAEKVEFKRVVRWQARTEERREQRHEERRAAERADVHDRLSGRQ